MHLGYLDGLRALAALFVVVHHISSHTTLDAVSSTYALRVPLRILQFGHYAVDLFIVLSGFCLMLPVVRGNGRMRQSSLEFFRRRTWRILPAYYCAMLLSLVVAGWFAREPAGTIWDMSLPVTAKAILAHLFLVHDACGEKYSINYVFWSIGVEWRIYFVFPLLVLGWRQLGGWLTTGLAIVVSLVLYQWCVTFLHASLSAHYLGLFAMGMLGASISFAPEDAPERKVRWGWIVSGSLVVVGLLSKIKTAPNDLSPEYLRDYLVGLLSMSLLVFVSLNTHHPLYKALSYKPLVFIGTFAYSLYLIHAPLLQLFWQAVPSLHPQPWLLFGVLVLVGMPIIVAASYLFFLVCERPFLQKLRTPRSLVAKTVVEPAI